MPRYFFDIYDGTATFDDHGQEFVDLDAAIREGERILSDVSKDMLKEKPSGASLTGDVRDEGGTVVSRLVSQSSVLKAPSGA